jgi:hypothetical protein|tara:strand:- start:421 stop:573 length:153 start_codon:yes stop_codon:yes gene_type:complete
MTTSNWLNARVKVLAIVKVVNVHVTTVSGEKDAAVPLAQTNALAMVLAKV